MTVARAILLSEVDTNPTSGLLVRKRLPNELSEHDKSVPLLRGYLAVYGNGGFNCPEKRHPVRSGNQRGIHRIGRRRRIEPLGNPLFLLIVKLQATDQSRHEITLLLLHLEVYPCE